MMMMIAREYIIYSVNIIIIYLFYKYISKEQRNRSFSVLNVRLEKG